MELSPEFDRLPGTDGDTDVDLDLAQDELQDQDNDYIIEDARSENATGDHVFPTETRNDDVMLDDGGSQSDLQYDVLLQDEDLDDAGDYIQHDAGEYSVAPHETADPQNNGHATDDVFKVSSPISEPKNVPPEHPQENLVGISDYQTYASREDDTLRTLDVDENNRTLESISVTPAADLSVDRPLETGEDELDWPENPALSETLQSSPLISKAENRMMTAPQVVGSIPGSSRLDAVAANHEPTFELTSVHPVIVTYQNTEISLFPPTDQSDSPTFFLHDEKLATSSIGDLLLACRDVLADSITDEDELELRIEELGLCIGEVNCLGLRMRIRLLIRYQDSKSASSTTLSQILSVYLQLLHQDGVSDVGPLYMILSIRTSFAKRFRGLIDAAKQGKGISQLPYWEISSDDDDDEATAAADGDVGHGTADEQSEERESRNEAAEYPSSEDHSTQGTLRTIAKGLISSQDDTVTPEPLHERGSSHSAYALESAANLDSHDTLTMSDTIQSVLSNGASSAAEDKTLPPDISGPAQDMENSSSSANMHQVELEEEADLIDYGDDDEVPAQNSTGSSTIAGNHTVDSETHHNNVHVPANDAEGGLQATDDKDVSPSKPNDAKTKASEESPSSSRKAEFDEPGAESVNIETEEHLDERAELPDDAETLGQGTGNTQDDVFEQMEGSDIDDPGAGGLHHSELQEQGEEGWEESSDALETNGDHAEAKDDHLPSHRKDAFITSVDSENPYTADRLSTAADDEINYEEDEILDISSTQDGEENPNPLLSSPTSTSTKRPRAENPESYLTDEGTQGMFYRRLGLPYTDSYRTTQMQSVSVLLESCTANPLQIFPKCNITA